MQLGLLDYPMFQEWSSQHEPLERPAPFQSNLEFSTGYQPFVLDGHRNGTVLAKSKGDIQECLGQAIHQCAKMLVPVHPGMSKFTPSEMSPLFNVCETCVFLY